MKAKHLEIPAYLAWLALMVYFFLTVGMSCKPLSVKEKTVEKRDSIVYKVRIDTLRITDSVKTIVERQGFNQREILELMALMRMKKDTTIYLTGSSGKTEIHLQDGRGYLKTESTDKYHAEYQRRIDTFEVKLKQLKESHKVIVKAPSFWDKLKDNLVWVFIIVGMATGFFIYLKLKK